MIDANGNSCVRPLCLLKRGKCAWKRVLVVWRSAAAGVAVQTEEQKANQFDAEFALREVHPIPAASTDNNFWLGFHHASWLTNWCPAMMAAPTELLPINESTSLRWQLGLFQPTGLVCTDRPLFCRCACETRYSTMMLHTCSGLNVDFDQSATSRP